MTCIENPKDTKKNLELINSEKFVAVLYTSNKLSEKEIKAIPFTIALKRINYLRINTTKEVKKSIHLKLRH